MLKWVTIRQIVVNMTWLCGYTDGIFFKYIIQNLLWQHVNMEVVLNVH